MAEEIALHIALDRAAEIVSENSEDFELWTAGLPDSHFDLDFDGLHNDLFQDKDYEIAYLDNENVAGLGDLQEWFEDFRFPKPRGPDRGSAASGGSLRSSLAPTSRMPAHDARTSGARLA